MMSLRRSALRLIASKPTLALSQPRNYSGSAVFSIKPFTRSNTIQFQRRWATDDAALKKVADQETPISELQATPQEEVENAIHQDNTAAESSSTSASSQSAPQSSSEDKPSSPVEKATEAVSNVAQKAKEVIQKTAGKFRETLSDKPHQQLVNTPKRTVYIGNLFFDVSEGDLVKELTRFGPIKKCKLLRDPRGLSKGFAYVEFEAMDSAAKAIETLNQQVFEGRRLNVQYAAYESSAVDDLRKQNSGPYISKNAPSKTLYIGNMSFDMTDRDLNNLFRGIRNVIDVRVAIDRRTGQPRGFAHADFIDVKSAMEAMKLLENKELYGRKLRIDYSFGPSTAPKNIPQE